MVRFLSAALLLCAVSASASPAIPSFEFSAAQLQASVAALRAAQVQAKAGSIGPQIGNMAWDLERSARDFSRLQNDLRFLQMRLRNHRRPGNGQPDRDPSLGWDVQRFTRDLAQLARDSQWRLDDLRALGAQAEKDETLVAPAARLLDATHRLKDEAKRLLLDARFAYFDFLNAGYPFDAMDMDRNTRDADARAQDLQNEADKLLAKVRG